MKKNAIDFVFLISLILVIISLVMISYIIGYIDGVDVRIENAVKVQNYE